MYYSDEIINEVLAANDIIDMVSGYVNLKRTGKDYVGLCPFHKEKTPSFHVSADKQLYHCFGCGVGGTVVNFVMKAENLDFVEALKLLADRAKIALPEPDTGKNAGELYQRKQRMYKLNTIAAHYFYNCLNSEEGKEAMDYFTRRGIKRRTITTFGLGFSPDSSTSLKDYLVSQGYSKEELTLSGLCIVKNGKTIDKFRNRIMFPIIDVRGNVIGFGGRVISDAEPKYLNSPETVVFNKSRNLYALNFAKNAKSTTLILAEGYMDVISLHQAGITNVVATLGTAIGDDQAKLLCRYADQVAICYDSDAAGKTAASRAIDIINSVGGKARVITLLDSKDPDEFIKKHSKEAFLSLVKAAPVSTRYKLNELMCKFNLDILEEKIQFADEAAKVLAALDNPIEMDAYANELANVCGIKSESLLAEVRRIQSRRRRQRRVPLRQVSEGKGGSVIQSTINSEVSPRLVNAEKMLLNLTAVNQKAFKRIQNQLDNYIFSNDIHNKLYNIIKNAYNSDQIPNTAAITTVFNGDEASYIAGLLCTDIQYENPLSAADDLINTMFTEKIKMQIARETDPKKLKELLLKQAGLKEGGIPRWEK